MAARERTALRDILGVDMFRVAISLRLRAAHPPDPDSTGGVLTGSVLRA